MARSAMTPEIPARSLGAVVKCCVLFNGGVGATGAGAHSALIRLFESVPRRQMERQPDTQSLHGTGHDTQLGGHAAALDDGALVVPQAAQRLIVKLLVARILREVDVGQPQRRTQIEFILQVHARREVVFVDAALCHRAEIAANRRCSRVWEVAATVIAQKTCLIAEYSSPSVERDVPVPEGIGSGIEINRV